MDSRQMPPVVVRFTYYQNLYHHPYSEMTLPLELVDEVLDYLPPDNESLRNCSLVAKSWLRPSRQRLFENLFIQDAECQSWLDNIPPTNIELLQHVRSFCFASSDPWGRDSPPHEYIDINNLYVYFPSFHRLHTISLSNARISPDIPERMDMFSPCQHVLSSLILADVSLPWRSFIALIDYFPNLRNLGLSYISFEDDNRDSPPLSRPLHGKLCFYMSQVAAIAAFSGWLSTGPRVEYDELVADVGYFSATHSRRIITACGKSLKRLRLEVCECFVSRSMLERRLTGRLRSQVGAPVTLSHFPELRELEFSVLQPTTRHRDTVSSITSVNIRKIIFSHPLIAATLQALTNNTDWKSFDDCVSALADKLRGLGNKQTLEVELRTGSIVLDPLVDYSGFLSKFREKGRVSVVDRSSGQILGLDVGLVFSLASCCRL